MPAPQLVPLLDRIRAKRYACIAALGDSNTANAHFTHGGKQWCELMHQELRDQYATQELTLVNAGVSGDSVAEALKRIDRDVIRFRPDLTIVALGSNDAKRLSDEQFRAGMVEAIERLQAAGSLVMLRTPAAVMEYEPKPEHLWPGDDHLKPKLAIIRELAAQRQLAFVDTYAQFWQLEREGKLRAIEAYDDAVHLNALGHQLVWRGMAETLGCVPTFMWER